MKTKTTASMFTGGGLFDIGAIAAGYEPIWGIEYDDKIAAVARLNGLPVITQDVTKLMPSDFSNMKRPDHLHASPPCPNFSIAKTGAKETKNDVDMADAVCYAITVLQPDTFTLENVPAYIHSQSFKNIIQTLHDAGYFVDWQNLNAANFGVPQTRNRLWVRASKRLMMPYPAPFKWVGWYEAIEDLIPSLPDSEFAPWQIARLPKEYKDFLIGQGARSTALESDQPAQTIMSNSNQSGVKALVLDGQTNDNGKSVTVRHGDEPIFTQSASGEKRPIRGFVVSSGNASRDVTVNDSESPHYTVTASMSKTPSCAYAGRVVKMTVQALGRFQTVPDGYKGLTVKINGNGVPCKLATAVLETL